jgi:acyl-coenzyme A thioesterase PaaI-like protein
MGLVDKIIEKAPHSGFYLMLLNFGLSRKVPFNRPHGIRIASFNDERIKTTIPYRKSNFNHIRGLHACSLATLAEFTTGFLLLQALDPKKYRLIMSNLAMEFHYQGKTDAYATFSITPQWLEDKIMQPLKQDGVAAVDCIVEVRDINENHLATGTISWQIKDWNKVKTAPV